MCWLFFFLFSIIHWNYVWCWFNYSEFLFVYSAVNIKWIHFNYPNVNGMYWIWSKLFIFNIIRKLIYESILQIEYYNVYNFVNTNFVSSNWIDGFLCMQRLVWFKIQFWILSIFTEICDFNFPIVSEIIQFMLANISSAQQKPLFNFSVCQLIFCAELYAAQFHPHNL